MPSFSGTSSAEPSGQPVRSRPHLKVQRSHRPRGEWLQSERDGHE